MGKNFYKARQLPVAGGWLLLVAVFTVGLTVRAEDKPAEKLEPPRVVMSVPLSVAQGTTTIVIVRGWKLDQTSEVKLSQAEATTKILNQGNAPVPNGQEASQIGDQQVVVELTIPENATEERLQLSLVTPGGTSEPYSLALSGALPDMLEVEPNDGFEKGHAVELPLVIAGQIQNDRDVDVFTFTAEKGSPLHAQVIARASGSGLDSLLTLFDSNGNILATNDDTLRNDKPSADAELNVTLPATGQYRLVLQDAHDHGGPAHPYRLKIEATKK